MKKLKEYKYIIIISLLVLGLVFYLYYWKPQQRVNFQIATCVKYAEEKAKFEQTDAEQRKDRVFMYGKYYNEQLHDCMLKKDILDYWTNDLVQQSLLR